ncbi:FISUMP domain-containing protein [candidate division KSB1 bacterium]
MRKLNCFYVFFITAIIILLSENVNGQTGTVTDIDGNVYNTIKIGDQWWMAENLKVTHYRNGDAIPNVTDNSAWASLNTGAYCNYNNDESYVSTYGRLYNWYAVNDSRKIAPAGWRVASDEDWKVLEIFLGMSQEEADKTGGRGSSVNVGGELKESSTSYWYSPNSGATNESGFTALPHGYRSNDYRHNFKDMGLDGIFWSSSFCSSNSSWTRHLYYNQSGIHRHDNLQKHGFAVRCVRNFIDETLPEIDLSVSPEKLWPPDHQMFEIAVNIVVNDDTDPEPQVKLVSITSNGSDNSKGDGNFINDIQSADFGTDDSSFFLRAERSGNGEGRIYTIIYSAIDFSGNIAFDTAYVKVEHDKGKLKKSVLSAIPDTYELFQNYPNPFNPETTIMFTLPKTANVKLEIYNIQGREIKSILNQTKPAGYHSVKWDGTNNNGVKVNSGVYVYRLQAGEFVETRKMILLK